jgi:type I restriction enzyme S subunit
MEPEESQKIQRYHRADCLVFRKTTDPFGGLSNMCAGYSLTVQGTSILTSEALYQACKFPEAPGIQRAIVAEASPMAAKMVAKKNRSAIRPDWLTLNVPVMWWCLQVKLAQNWESFSGLLLNTAPRPLVEESGRDAFWGAIPIDDDLLEGANVLGRLLMELRTLRQGPEADALKQVAPPDIANFLLFGKPVETVSTPQNGV